MTISELKTDLHKTIDSLKFEQLNEVSGLISNYINGGNGESEWSKLSDFQRNGLLDARESISRKSTAHSDAMKEFRQKVYNNE